MIVTSQRLWIGFWISENLSDQVWLFLKGADQNTSKGNSHISAARHTVEDELYLLCFFDTNCSIVQTYNWLFFRRLSWGLWKMYGLYTRDIVHNGEQPRLTWYLFENFAIMIFHKLSVGLKVNMPPAAMFLVHKRHYLTFHVDWKGRVMSCCIRRSAGKETAYGKAPNQV